MRVPCVRAFALKKRDHVAQSFEIIEPFPTSVAIENDQRYSPEALARNAPVRPVDDHVVDALFTPCRQPLNFFDFVQRAAAERGRLRGGNRCAAGIELYEPLFSGAKNHWFMAAPAMWIAVREFLFANQHPTFRQQRNDRGIRFEHRLAFVFRQAFDKAAVIIERSIGFQPISLAGCKVFGTMTGSGVNDSAALIQRDVISEYGRHAQLFQERMLTLNAFEFAALSNFRESSARVP